MNEKEAKQLRKREYLLTGNMWEVAVSIALPVVFYNLCNYLYGIFDMLLVQSANIGEAADIIVLDQIKNMISSVGGALAAGGGIIIARKFGANELGAAKKYANTLFTVALAVALITLLFIPFGEPFLKLFKTDSTTIENAMGYYNVQIVTLVVTTVNSSMIAIEKAKGDTVRLMGLNLVVIVVKLGLTTLFAFGPFENVTSTWLAAATLIAQLFMLITASILCFHRDNTLRISIKEWNFDFREIRVIITLAAPIFIGNFLFNFGKVYVNAVATEQYGKMCVGALGISNTIAGLLPTITNSFSDSGSVIVSQNFGNRNVDRIRSVFKVSLSYITAICLLGTAVLYPLRAAIAAFFAPKDALYQKIIIAIFSWECLDVLFLGFLSVANAVFNGTGKTKMTMVFSLIQLFCLRIPILLLLMQIVRMDYTACGVAMFSSNFLSGMIALLFAVVFLKKLTKYKFEPSHTIS